MKYVAYYRLSKKSEGRGLGIDAQESIIRHYYKDDIVKEFYEVKSAKNITGRPILQEAITYCKKHGYTLIVAKLDRLSRNVDDCRLILKELGTQLKSCDIPGELDRFTLTMFAAFAERERELIALRTSQALQEKEKHIKQWRKAPKRLADYRLNSTQSIKEKALNNENNIRASELICSKVKDGLNYSDIARLLNQKKFRTSKGKEFQPVQVQRIHERFC